MIPKNVIDDADPVKSCESDSSEIKFDADVELDPPDALVSVDDNVTLVLLLDWIVLVGTLE